MSIGKMEKDGFEFITEERYKAAVKEHFESHALDYIDSLSSEERHAFFDKVFEKYCKYCGDPHPIPRRCQCWRDE